MSMSMYDGPIEIRVDEIVPGDTWVGNDNVLIDEVDHEGGVEVLVAEDYRAGRARQDDVILMRLIRFHGTIVSGDDKGLVSWWSLRPDQIVEVQRG